mgnify:FL=1
MIRAGKLFGGLAIALGGLCLAQAAYIPAKAKAGEMLLSRAWAKSQNTGAPVLPWPSMDALPLAKLSAPRLGVSEIILNAGTGQAMSFAPAHLELTPPPGQPGLSVIAAHKNTHFAFLEHIKTGDIIEIENIDGGIHRFKITRLVIADKDNSGIDLNAPKHRAQIALVTCYPFSALSYGGPLRYIAYADAL